MSRLNRRMPPLAHRMCPSNVKMLSRNTRRVPNWVPYTSDVKCWKYIQRTSPLITLAHIVKDAWDGIANAYGVCPMHLKWQFADRARSQSNRARKLLYQTPEVTKNARRLAVK